MGGSSKSTATETENVTENITTQDTRTFDYASANASGDAVSLGGANNSLVITDGRAFDLADTVVRQQSEFLEDAGILLGETFTSVLNLGGGRDDLDFDSAEINDQKFTSGKTDEELSKALPYVAAVLAIGAVGYALTKD